MGLKICQARVKTMPHHNSELHSGEGAVHKTVTIILFIHRLSVGIISGFIFQICHWDSGFSSETGIKFSSHKNISGKYSTTSSWDL